MFDQILGVDVAPYGERKVMLHKFEWGFVSTAAVPDGRKPFETAIQSRDYKTVVGLSSTIIVDSYATKKAAEEGHARWVETMTKNPPQELADCLNGWSVETEKTLGEKHRPRKVRI